jgi:hypothetical protein
MSSQSPASGYCLDINLLVGGRYSFLSLPSSLHSAAHIHHLIYSHCSAVFSFSQPLQHLISPSSRASICSVIYTNSKNNSEACSLRRSIYRLRSNFTNQHCRPNAPRRRNHQHTQSCRDVHPVALPTPRTRAQITPLAPHHLVPQLHVCLSCLAPTLTSY